MALRVTKLGRKWVMQKVLADLMSFPVRMHLFQANITPSQDDVDATYNVAGVEADFSGYAMVPTSGWPSAATTTGEQEVGTANSCLFQVAISPSITNQIYGYYMKDFSIDTHVYWAERFAGAPLSMTVAGDAIVVVPAYSEQSQFA